MLTWFSRLAETAYGTKALAAADYRRLGELNRTLFNIKPTFEADMENAGSDEAAQAYISTNIFQNTNFQQFFSFQDIGYWLQMIFGAYNKSGAGAPFTHTFTPLNKTTSRQHPVRTFGQRRGTDIFIYTSIGVQELSIEKDSVGRLKVSITLDGMGVVNLNPASYAAPAVVTDRIYGFNNQAAQTINDTIATVNYAYQCEVESWKWTFTNERIADSFRDCSAEFTAGSPKAGIVRAENLTSRYNWKWSARVRYDSAKNPENFLRAGNLVTLTTAITSSQLMTATPYSLTISDTQAQILSADPSAKEGDFIFYDIEGECRASKSTGLLGAQAVLVNDVASYIV
jgi:hypothetical protein